ncbi:hypothetical protein [Mycobacterium parmense]|nr:hypothetical protein [Mycobacterium parmense]MCV7351907.1 hypothetical protein [Mycobacterium parmense]ORW56695.1 hypothetical protein AWC20_02340 [Mycobacterium parmense]
MKLARPDVFHPRILLAGDGDGDGLVAALRRRGLHARRCSWDDPVTVSADLVILQRIRGYADRRAELLAWTRRVRHLLNPPAAVAWNLGERHLDELEAAGVSVLRGVPADAALIFLAGRQSHAFAGAGPIEPEFEVWEAGHAALASAAERAGVAAGELLYARVDVVGTRLVALDLVGPSLGWRCLGSGDREQAERRFALAVESACERLGLGPLSH